MRRLLTCGILILVFHFINAQDTFSIIATDPETGEIGAAGASCVDGAAQFGGVQLINKIIPGRGGANAQALICINPNINLDNAIKRLEEGLTASQTLQWLQGTDQCAAGGFNPEERQYGLLSVDINGNIETAGFSGSENQSYSNHITGPNYSIQGNILLGAEVLEAMETNFNNTEGSLAAKLMAAMQGANIPGADSRCLGRGTSSTSGFLRVYRPDDEIENPYLFLNILEMPFGEEPIDSLQILFDEWVKTTGTEDDQDEKDSGLIKVYPNPVVNMLEVSLDNSVQFDTIYFLDIRGSVIMEIDVESVGNIFGMDASRMPEGMYIIQAVSKDKKIFSKKFEKVNE